MAEEERTDLFASTRQMEQRSLGAITEQSHPYLTHELAAATDLIREACRWHIAPRKQLQLIRRFGERERVWLPAMQIESIDEVTVDGKLWSAEQLAAVQFDPLTGWTSIVARHVDVKFTAGYAAPPSSLVSLTLQIAARALGSPLGLVREQAGTVNVTHTQVGSNQAGGALLLPIERSALVPYQLGWLP